MDFFQHRVGQLIRLLARHALGLDGTERDVIAHVQVRPEIEQLEHHGDLAALRSHLPVTHQAQTLTVLDLPDQLVPQPDLATSRFFQVIDATQAGGLSRSAWANQRQGLTGLQLQADALEHFQIAIVLV
ncbi:hypothetical protein D3C80_1691870 [compost metagenome]